MNYKLLGKVLGKIMILESILMIAPLLVSLIYGEGIRNAFAFLIPICALALLGFLTQKASPKRRSLYQKEGFALTALVWLVLVSSAPSSMQIPMSLSTMLSLPSTARRVQVPCV